MRLPIKRTTLLTGALTIGLGFGYTPSSAGDKGDVYKISADTLSGKVNFSDFKGKPILITNTASGCGYTSQLGDLQKVHEKYQKKGLVVIGFPTNDFNQESLDDVKVGEFCKKNYGVTFTMSKKIHVNGSQRHPLYKFLVDNDPTSQGNIGWNFEKFLVDKNGKVIARYSSSVNPTSPQILEKIENSL
jgi:glutathione peroxidase